MRKQHHYVMVESRRWQSRGVMNVKSIFASKTFWVQVVVLVATLFPVTKQYLGDETWVLQVLAALNVLLRVVTKDKVVIFPDSNSRIPTLLLWIGLAGLVGLSSPSCNSLSRGVDVGYADKDGNTVQYDSAAGLKVRVIEDAK